MVPRLTTVHEDARSALECASEAERSCRLPLGKNKAAAGATALQGASRIFMAAKALALDLTSLEAADEPGRDSSPRSLENHPIPVIPAKAGIQFLPDRRGPPLTRG